MYTNEKPSTSPIYAAIPTMYRGVRMRSRLEAKWTHLLEWAGCKRWEYEPFDLNGWIPDLLLEHIPGLSPQYRQRKTLHKRPILVEIKPIATEHVPPDVYLKIEKALNSPKFTKEHCGEQEDWDQWHESLPWDLLVLGLSPHHAWMFEPFAGWTDQGCCQIFGGADENYAVIGEQYIGFLPEGWEDAWKAAGNATQWRGSR